MGTDQEGRRRKKRKAGVNQASGAESLNTSIVQLGSDTCPPPSSLPEQMDSQCEANSDTQKHKCVFPTYEANEYFPGGIFKVE